MEGLDQKKVVVAFNKGDGGTDIQLPIELDVIDTGTDGQRTRSDQAMEKFVTCLYTLTTSLDAN